MEDSKLTMERFIQGYKPALRELYIHLYGNEQSKNYPQLRLKYMVDDYRDIFSSSKK